MFKNELGETEVGQELYSQLEKLAKRQMALLERIEKERKATPEASVLAELQSEYNELREQIDVKLRHVQELKSSRFQSLRRLFSRKRG
ncbi:hypothetical protein OG21DRAFT_1510198 [Imleria badia]|nr:hypothetical protein OG21DRAFT_1510198 [Imleria badia]